MDWVEIAAKVYVVGAVCGLVLGTALTVFLIWAYWPRNK